MSDTNITVYSTTWCSFCHMAKNYFDKLGVKYTDRDIEQEPAAAEELIKKSGQMGIPVIDIAGTIIVGFDRPKIDAALKSNKLT